MGLTPPMGWNSWNHFGCNISENLIKKTADALVKSGLAAKGYVYVNLDDCWQVHAKTFRRLATTQHRK
jgi:alpha-galactosidase